MNFLSLHVTVRNRIVISSVTVFAEGVFLGIWDCQSSQTVVEFVRRGIVEKQELSKICENMMDSCLAPSSETGGVGCDNMTMIIVALLKGKTKDEWYKEIADRVARGDGPCTGPDYGNASLSALP